MLIRALSLAVVSTATLLSTAGAARADDCVLWEGSYSNPIDTSVFYYCENGPTEWLRFMVYYSGSGASAGYYLYGDEGADVFFAPYDHVNENNYELERFEVYGMVVNAAGVATQVCELGWVQGWTQTSSKCTSLPNQLRVYVNPQEP